jgi:hypothetical protein
MANPELKVSIGANIDNLEKELAKTKKGLQGVGDQADRLAKRFKKAGEKMKAVGRSMSTYVTLPLLAIGGASIKMASDFAESLNKVDVAFKDSSHEVKEFAKITLETFGIAEGTALDMAALFGDMGTSMGIPTDQAAILATSLVGLAGDMSSFKNINIKEVTTALNGVFTGETESLKRMGIVMTIANLKAYALTQGLSDNIEAMTQAEKVNLRYAYILSITGNAQGDFARTSDGSANQMRIFTETIKELSVAFGNVLLPIFTKIISYVNKVLKGFIGLSKSTKILIVVVASLVAAIGPLLVVLGVLITTALPGVIKFFTYISAKLIPALIVKLNLLTATIARNPFGFLAVAIAAVGSYFLFFNNKVDETIKKQTLLSEVNDKASKSIANERAKLVELLGIAKHEGVSKKQRILAINELNRISPKYLGNLTLETINTENATSAVKKYNEELINSATVKAAQVKLQEISSKKIDIELKEAKKLVKNAEKLVQLKEDAVTIEDFLKIKTLEKIGYATKSNGIHSAKLQQLKQEEDLLLGIITKNKTLNEVSQTGLNNVNVETRAKVTPLDLDSLKVPLSTGLSNIDKDIPKLAPRIDTSGFREDLLEITEIGSNISSAFSGIGEAIGKSLASGENMMSALGGVLLNTLGDIAIKLGQTAIGIGVAMSAIKLSFSNPFTAIAAGIALVAIGSAIKGVSGIVSGGSSSGGSNGASSSSFSGSSSSGGNYGASNNGGLQNVVFEIQGTKLVGVISKTLARNRSLGGSLSLI